MFFGKVWSSDIDLANDASGDIAIQVKGCNWFVGGHIVVTLSGASGKEVAKWDSSPSSCINVITSRGAKHPRLAAENFSPLTGENASSISGEMESNELKSSVPDISLRATPMQYLRTHPGPTFSNGIVMNSYLPVPGLRWLFPGVRFPTGALPVLNPSSASRNRLGGCNVFIYGLPIQFADDRLRNLFASFGRIVSVKVVLDKQGLSNGFGFVRYDNQISTQAAISAMDGQQLGAKRLKVAYGTDPKLGL